MLYRVVTGVGIAIVSVLGLLYWLGAPQAPVGTTEDFTTLAAGAELRELVGRNELGDIVRVPLAATDRSTVVYIVRASCDWCQKNHDNFITLASEGREQFQFAIVVLPSAGGEKLVRELRSDQATRGFPILTALSGETSQLLLPSVTPRTLVVAKDGRVEREWLGAYTRGTLVSVENYFLVRMPGLTAVN